MIHLSLDLFVPSGRWRVTTLSPCVCKKVNPSQAGEEKSQTPQTTLHPQGFSMPDGVFFGGGGAQVLLAGGSRALTAVIPTGHCTWGMNCRFIHPGVNDKGNYSLISKPEPFSPNGAPPMGPHPLMPANPWVWNLFCGFRASAAPCPSLQGFKVGFWRTCSSGKCPFHWNKMSFKVSSKPNHSTIL